MHVTVEGNVGNEPELRFSDDGKARLKFTVAADQGKDKPPLWVEVTVWDKPAEKAADSIVKGTRVVVSGTLEEYRYEKKDGTEGRALQLSARNVGLSTRFTAYKEDA
jgi:single-strand DNA-binding protein